MLVVVVLLALVCTVVLAIALLVVFGQPTVFAAFSYSALQHEAVFRPSIIPSVRHVK